MKKLDGIKYCIFILLIVSLFSICMMGCSNAENNTVNKYEFGTMENIDDKFEIVNSTSGQVAVSGEFETVVVNHAETKDGGMVAWKDNEFAYTKDASEVSSLALCSRFAEHFGYVKPVQKNSWGPEKK